MNLKAVFRTVGQVLLLEAVLMALPIIPALVYGESIVPFLIAVGAAALAGAVLTLVFRGSQNGLCIRDGFAIVSLSWVAISLFGALPFTVSGEIPSYVDAVFEAVSGFTTTGASILDNVEALSRGMLFWRSFTHWLGGMGVLVFIMAFLGNAPDRSINILRAEMPGPSVDKLVPRAKGTVRILYILYLALSVVEVIFLLCGGMNLFESIVHTFGTAGTGGFGIKLDSLAGYSPYIQWVITIFMLLFGVSFNLYYLMLLRRWRDVAASNELWSYLGIFAAATAVIALNILPLYNGFGQALRLSAFQVSSILTTTGYSTADFDLWPQLSRTVLFLLMFLGGCAGSTAGGLKISRVVTLAQSALNDLRRSIRPRAVTSVRLNGRQLTREEERAALSYFLLYNIVLLAVFLLISFEPYSIETNLTAAVACFNNIGPGLAQVGPAASFRLYSDFSTIILTFAMLLGRLELYPLLLTFSPRMWLER